MDIITALRLVPGFWEERRKERFTVYGLGEKIRAQGKSKR